MDLKHFISYGIWWDPVVEFKLLLPHCLRVGSRFLWLQTNMFSEYMEIIILEKQQEVIIPPIPQAPIVF